MDQKPPQQLRLEMALGRTFPRRPVQELEVGDEICDIDHFPQRLYTGIVKAVEIISPTHRVQVRVLMRDGAFIRPYGHTVIVGDGLIEFFRS